MPKPITLEMLQAMSPDQLKTLHANAMGLDTPAARDVLLLLTNEDLVGRPKPPAVKKAPSARRKVNGSKPPANVKVAAVKPVQAKHGRQS